MSADNWGYCPKGPHEGASTDNTLREDYEVFIEDDGTFHLHYRAECSKRHGGCGWHFEKSLEEKVT